MPYMNFKDLNMFYEDMGLRRTDTVFTQPFQPQPAGLRCTDTAISGGIPLPVSGFPRTWTHEMRKPGMGFPQNCR